MKDKKGYIKAFTMVDVLTGMIISSIIIGMVFYVFTSLNKQLADYGKTRAKINEYLLLKADFGRHFEAEDHLCFGAPKGMKVETDSSAIYYWTEGTFLLRSVNGVFDTLTATLQDFELTYFQDHRNEPTNQVASLHVSMKLEEQLLSASFHKRQGDSERMNKQLYNEL